MVAITAPPTQTNPFSPFLDPPSRMLIRVAVNEETAQRFSHLGIRMEARSAETIAQLTEQRIARAEAVGQELNVRIDRTGNLQTDEDNFVEVQDIELSMLVGDALQYGFEDVDVYITRKDENTRMKKKGQKTGGPSYHLVFEMRPGEQGDLPTGEAWAEIVFLFGQAMKFCQVYMNSPDNNVTVNCGRITWKNRNLKTLRLGRDGKFRLEAPPART